VPVRSKHQQICSEIVRLLREERERQGLTIYALAKGTGLSHQAITYIEREQRIPSLETTLRIADALQINLGKVISDSIKSTRPA
jgi:transcriptional regulator with XRE-family HTH domain